MSVFRIEKNRNYTAMSNYHLRDTRLSLRTIGLLSIMLSLPENWDYSQEGLAKICKDGITSIKSAIQELEEFGYLERKRERDERGMLAGMIYCVYEVPKQLMDEGVTSPDMPKSQPSSRKNNGVHNQNSFSQEFVPTVEHPTVDYPTVENPLLDNPPQDTPIQEYPIEENSGQRNIYILNTQKINTEKQNTDVSFPSIYPSSSHNDASPRIQESDRWMDGQREKPNGLESYNHWVEVIKQQINYNFFVSKEEKLLDQLSHDLTREEYDKESQYFNTAILDEIIGYMADILNSNSRQPIKVGSDYVDREVLKQRILQTTIPKIKSIIYAISTTDIRNKKNYVLSMIYN